MRSPSRRPGPRNEDNELRLALSYDALNTYGMPRSRVMAAIDLAIRSAWSSLSITQGPAMSASGAPPPITTPPPTGTARVAWPPSAGGRPVALAGIDEAPKERMRLDR